ncbi:YIP1 family protein [Profundibacterium mesophilum]|uniref:Yip1 domain containing protein n=1 Tax=Profundibacterium mesophilum KAUST100406-0324 TaxID=1037889 RepID=A0A921NUJ3_9RHOB|nr:YIP1 family protein [Profundibacterium mesophilum]KAF0675039.1 Yip1 domain containing protein [Profundibacterium mesophilum KAUST100406-0324]
MALTTDILRSYVRPAEVLRRRMAGSGEDRALVTVMLACGLIFVAQWPRLSREAFLSGQEMEMLVGGALLGWLFLAPLALYAIAAISHLAARLMGGAGSFFEARMALFWALLAAAPLWLLWGLVAGLVGPGPGLDMLGIVALLAFLWIWLAGLWSVETSRVVSN